MTPLHWRITGYIVAAAIFLYMFAQWQQRAATEDQGPIRAARVVLAMKHSFEASNGALAKRAEQALGSARTSAQAVLRLRGQLREALTPQDTIRIQVILVDSLTAQRDSLSLAGAFQRARAERAEARVSLLEQNLAATLNVASCHLLGVKWLPSCPSRNASLVLGLGTGAIAILALHR